MIDREIRKYNNILISSYLSSLIRVILGWVFPMCKAAGVVNGVAFVLFVIFKISKNGG